MTIICRMATFTMDHTVLRTIFTLVGIGRILLPVTFLLGVNDDFLSVKVFGHFDLFQEVNQIFGCMFHGIKSLTISFLVPTLWNCIQDDINDLIKAKLGKNSSGNPNKSWSRKADDAKKKTAKDLKSYAKKAIREEVHAITKKRKTAELDMNALEKEFEDIDLSQFDEDDLMKGIESDSENGNTSD